MNADARRWAQVILLSAFICVHLRFIPNASAQKFEKHWLSAQFYSEGANAGDFNHDGKMDVVSGPFNAAGLAASTRMASSFVDLQ